MRFCVKDDSVVKACVSGRLSEVILKFRDLIEKLEKDVYAVLRLEKEEKEMALSEAQDVFQVYQCIFKHTSTPDVCVSSFCCVPDQFSSEEVNTERR